MKIAFDIDYFGLAYANPKDKTGIYRVVENTLSGLVSANNIEVRLYAQKHLTESVKYIKTHPVLCAHKYPVKINKCDLVWLRLDEYTRQKKQTLQRRTKINPVFDIWKKATVKGLSFTRRFIPNIREAQKKNLNEILKQSDIYHSPFLGISDSVRSHKNLRCFLTVYDLIPILFPEYVVKHSMSWTEQAIRSLQPNDWIFSISEATKNDLCEFQKSVSPDRIIVTPLAASTRMFYPCKDKIQLSEVKEKYGIPKETTYFLGLGNLAPHKNFKALINSFVSLIDQEDLSDVVLVIVGSKAWEVADKAIFPDIMMRSDVQKKIIFTGRVADEDLSPLYSGSLGFVFMSFYEGFGLPPLEAMQCGVPVITSNTSSLPEVVGDAGIMLDPKDEDGLCQAMLNLYNDPALRAEMSRKSLKQAAKFSWDKTVQQTIQGYKMALNV